MLDRIPIPSLLMMGKRLTSCVAVPVEGAIALELRRGHVRGIVPFVRLSG
jgi:hypothetical protein